MSRTDEIYEQVTTRIMDALREGTVPWHKPWSSDSADRVQNLDRRAYSGINVWLLELEAMAAGYGETRWGTYKSISAHGGQVRKGERGTRIIFWSRIDKDKNDPDAGSFMLLKTYTVFNAEQADWETPLPPLERAEPGNAEPDERADEVIESYAANLRGGLNFGGDRAFYHPTTDAVKCPPRESFKSTAGFYSTVFHELAHSTGHEERLNRLEKAGFGTTTYAREELVAEMAAAMLTTSFGFEVEIDNSAAYIAAWLKALENDHKLVVKAASEAQKAVALVLGEGEEV